MGPEEAAEVMLKFFDDAAIIYGAALEAGHNQKDAFRILRDQVVRYWGATPRAASNITRIVIHRTCLQQGWVSPYTEKDLKKITNLAFSR